MRKVLGILMIIIGSIIFISAFFTLLADIPKIIMKLNNAEGYGFLLGYLIMSALFFLLSIWLIRKGAKMLKPKVKEKSIEEKIGDI